MCKIAGKHEAAAVLKRSDYVPRPRHLTARYTAVQAEAHEEMREKWQASIYRNTFEVDEIHDKAFGRRREIRT